MGERVDSIMEHRTRKKGRLTLPEVSCVPPVEIKLALAQVDVERSYTEKEADELDEAIDRNLGLTGKLRGF